MIIHLFSSVAWQQHSFLLLRRHFQLELNEMETWTRCVFWRMAVLLNGGHWAVNDAIAVQDKHFPRHINPEDGWSDGDGSSDGRGSFCCNPMCEHPLDNPEMTPVALLVFRCLLVLSRRLHHALRRCKGPARVRACSGTSTTTGTFNVLSMVSSMTAEPNSNQFRIPDKRRCKSSFVSWRVTESSPLCGILDPISGLGPPANPIEIMNRFLKHCRDQEFPIKGWRKAVLRRVVFASQDFLRCLVIWIYLICITSFWPIKAYRDSLLNLNMWSS